MDFFMLGLILDTSTDRSLIALSKNHQLIAFSAIPHEQNLSRSLLPSIHQLLLENEISLKDLFKISVGIGPGSYTGTRIAVAVAESLSLALAIPLYSFCSLLAFLPPSLPQGPFAFVTNTHYSTWFLLKGYFDEGAVTLSCSHHILSKQEMLPFLDGVPALLTLPLADLRDHLPEIFSQGTRQLHAETNFSALIPYLTNLQTLSPKKPKILYLHHF